MSKHLLIASLMISALAACVSTAHNNTGEVSSRSHALPFSEPVTTSLTDIDTTYFVQHVVPENATPSPLTNLPRTQDGYFVLSPGYYEADFKTYCLQPGTPAPSARDAYFQAPLRGYRKDIIESVLTNSQTATHLDQKNVQLLLWSVVSRSDFNKLSPSVQSAAYQLLTPKQLFELKGGVLGVVKTVAKTLPSNGQHSIQQLFDRGINSYEAFERLAVTSGPSEISRPDFKRDQWFKNDEGYYVRYFPNGYKQTKIQVYVPQLAVQASIDSTDNYLLFNPASMVVVPANSNAQRLGVGGPLLEVATKVIKIIGKDREKKRPEPPKRPEEPRPSGHPGART